MKVHFIVFYKNQECLDKCLGCLNALKIPENVETDVLGVDEGESITRAYDACMESSDADIKIYIRENIYITDPDFLIRALDLFKNHEEVAMAGIIGGFEKKPGFIDWTVGSLNIFSDDSRIVFENPFNKDFEYVDYLSGQVLMTKKDFPWTTEEEDCDKFFDIYHSRKTTESGAKLAVINFQKPPVLWEYGKAFNERVDVYTPDKGAFTGISKEKPLVSVVMAVHNAEDFIEETLKSIQNQTYENLEIILSDDCSTDNTVKLLNGYAEKDSRIKVLISDRNRHVCYAENKAADKATGKYIALMGHDDLWRPSKIEKQVTFMEHETEYFGCFSHVHVINEKQEVKDDNFYYSVFHQENRSQKEWLNMLLFERNALCAPSALLRRSSLILPLYRLGFVQGQDYELWMRLLRNENLYVLQDCLTLYRQFEDEHTNLSDVGDAKTPNPAFIRAITEMQFFSYQFLMSLSTKELVKWFSERLVNPQVSDELEALCEKALILYKLQSAHYVDVFNDILDNPKGLETLENKYNTTLLDFYEMEKRRLW